MMQILDTVDRLAELVLPDDPPSPLGVVNDLIILRDAAEDQLVAGAAPMERLDMAKAAGRRYRRRCRPTASNTHPRHLMGVDRGCPAKGSGWGLGGQHWSSAAGR